jgi:hypothetical protein
MNVTPHRDQSRRRRRPLRQALTGHGAAAKAYTWPQRVFPLGLRQQARPRVLPVGPVEYLAGCRRETVAALETLHLVLDDDSPLPEVDQDVQDLVLRLRGHTAQLGAAVPSGDPALHAAQAMASTPVPEGFMPSRVYLRRHAEAVRDLVAVAEDRQTGAPVASRPGRRSWKPSLNVVRAAVFAAAFLVMAVGATVRPT